MGDQSLNRFRVGRNTTALDLKSLALPKVTTRPTAKAGPPRPRGGERFLKGPVALAWLAKAARLPGRALAVGVMLWYRAGLLGTGTVTLPRILLEQFGVDRHAKGRSLRALERAELVSVERRPGRSPKVTIVEVGGEK